ncbi:hypothetical protein OROGR_015007 [Orobanche gracilis]
MKQICQIYWRWRLCCGGGGTTMEMGGNGEEDGFELHDLRLTEFADEHVHVTAAANIK